MALHLAKLHNGNVPCNWSQIIGTWFDIVTVDLLVQCYCGFAWKPCMSFFPKHNLLNTNL